MKSIIFSLFLALSASCFSQSDTIFKMNGEKLPVNVSEITDEVIKFTYPGESITNSIGISSVSNIHFKSGRKQEFSSTLNVKIVKSCLEWENVQISKIESEVKGLSKIDLVGAKAKGVTTMSSLAKLQDRAFNKIKIETAMLGGNVAYIIEQNTEESVSGGQYGGSKAPGVTISALAYTSKKVFFNEISFGTYTLSDINELEANAYELSKVTLTPDPITINQENIFSENDFQKIKLNIKQIKDVEEYTIIYASPSELVLSGIKSTSQGKKTYYNLILNK
jgi:hypothetical protein